ncbi:MAG TPA: hypothetical protein VJU61_13630, partial [Polyangiaceae bacterium]|nr:hypothetical protein [Polyangiaceae bacterium]
QAHALLKRPDRVVTSGDNFPPREVRRRPDWVEDYYILNMPRPWVLWSAGLPAELRPVPLWPWLSVGVLGVAVASWQLSQRRQRMLRMLRRKLVAIT